MDPNLLGSSFQDWETPQDFFNKIHLVWNFNRDVCATEQSKKVKKYFGLEENGLLQKWDKNNWCNPPFKKAIEWVTYGVYQQSKGKNTVFVLPARNDTKLFHDVIWKHASRILFVKGRLKFIRHDIPNIKPFPAPFALQVIEFIAGKTSDKPSVDTWDWKNEPYPRRT